MEKSYRPLLQRIAEVEATCQVESLVAGSVHVWPLIRKFVWQQLVHSGKPVLPPAAKTRDFAMWNGAVTEFIAEGAVRSDSDACLFFSRPEDHADTFGGKWYNRHIDPLIGLLRATWPHVKLEIMSTQGVASIPRYEPTVFVNPPGTSPTNMARLGIEGWDKFGHSASRILGMPLNEMAFLPALQQVLVFKAFFQSVLTQLRPRAVFQICWYYEIAMALAWACRDANIPCVDVQHGKQGKYHGMYTHWTRLPQTGYELMPRFFWNWGEASKANIVQWFPAGHSYHTAIVGGNAWLSAWLSKTQPALEPPAEAFLEALASKKRVILLSLQPLDEIVPNCVMEAMAASPPDWIWLCRLHPLQKARTRELKAMLHASGIRGFEMEAATNLPLYALLGRATHHITGFSSVSYEALYFGLRTAIFHPVGRETYSEELAAGDFVWTDSLPAILEYLSAPKALAKTCGNYIEVSSAKALEVMSLLLATSQTRNATNMDSEGGNHVRLSRRNEQTRNCMQAKTSIRDLQIPREELQYSISQVLELLRTQGLALVPFFLSNVEVEYIRREAELAFQCEQQIEYVFGRALRLGERESLRSRYPRIAELFSMPAMALIANEYYNGPHVVNAEIHITHEFRSDRGVARNADLHFDRLHSLKYLIYLTDVDRNCGAFSCVPTSNILGRRLRQEAWKHDGEYNNVANRVLLDHPELGVTDSDVIPVEAPRGSLIIFDTDTFHRGGAIQAGRERMVIRGHCRRLGQAGGGGGTNSW